MKGWRKVPELESLAKADHGDLLMEETSADADQSVAAAFDLARSAIAAQNAIVGEVEPSVLGEAKDRKSSFWRKTPDFKAIVGLLTEAVEAKWTERRAETLWGDGERPSNADAQHAVLFPSVRKRIELVARQILEDMGEAGARAGAEAATAGAAGRSDGVRPAKRGGTAASQVFDCRRARRRRGDGQA